MARKNTQKLKENLERLKERFPNAFFDTKPLIPTIAEEMLAELGDDPLSALVKPTMRNYMRTPKYLKHVISRKWLHNLQGSKVRLITEEERQTAQKQYAQIEENNRPATARYRMALALAKESQIEFQKAELLPSHTDTNKKVLVITRKTKKAIDEP